MDSLLQGHRNENTWESSLQDDGSDREGNDRAGPFRKGRGKGLKDGSTTKLTVKQSQQSPIRYCH